LRDIYEQKIIPSGPIAVAATYKRNKVIVSFKYADGLKTTDRAALREIAVDGNNVTNAIIKKNSIHIAVDKKPQVVSYGWKPYSEGNLVNKAGLPASTFILKID
jgi:sialate O-acetylesterase